MRVHYSSKPLTGSSRIPPHHEHRFTNHLSHMHPYASVCFRNERTYDRHQHRHDIHDVKQHAS